MVPEKPEYICIKQPEKGYRYSLDAVVLAWHATPKKNQRIVDIGAGCGIISMLLARRFSNLSIYGIEIQESLAWMAQRNVVKNGMEDRIKIICGDLKNLSSEDIGGNADMAVVNPPFEKTKSARIGPDYSKTAATHEILTSISDIIQCCQRVLKVSGTLVMIYPAHRLVELVCALHACRMEPKWIRMIHPHTRENANRVIVKSVRHGGKGITIASPLYVHQPDGSYTPEVETMLRF